MGGGISVGSATTPCADACEASTTACGVSDSLAAALDAPTPARPNVSRAALPPASPSNCLREISPPWLVALLIVCSNSGDAHRCTAQARARRRALVRPLEPNQPSDVTSKNLALNADHDAGRFPTIRRSTPALLFQMVTACPPAHRPVGANHSSATGSTGMPARCQARKPPRKG